MIAIPLFVTGCGMIFDLSAPVTEVPEENLTITDNLDSKTYIYSDKAKILRDESYISSINILVNKDNNIWDTLLIGKLKKFAHYEDYLVMIFNGKYYSFNLDEYSVPKSEDYLQEDYLKYDLKEYSKDEFKEKFPKYESFEWRE